MIVLQKSAGEVRNRKAKSRCGGGAPCRSRSEFTFCILHFVLCLVFSPNSSLLADEKTPSAEETFVKQERFLGVVTEPVPDALAAQLKDRLPAGRGLVVKRLLPESPAEKAGVRPFDVLTAANDQPLSSPDQLKGIVTRSAPQSLIRLKLLREAKAQTVDVLPGERTISRLIHRHAGEDQAATGGKTLEKKIAAAGELLAGNAAESLPAYSVGVQTRDGRQFQVEVSYSKDGGEETAHKTSGTSAEVTDRLKSLPKPVVDCVARQIARVSEDRQTLRSVRFRFTPRPEGQQQVLKATLRKPQANGVTAAFEWQQPMGDARDMLPLQALLESSTFTAQLQDLDPAVRDKIESTLKQSTLPAGTLKVESSQ